MKSMVMVFGETEKGKRWLLDNVAQNSKHRIGPSVVTRTFQIEVLDDLIQEFNKAGLTIED